MAIHAQGALVVDLNLAHVHAPLDQLGTRSRQVGDDELQVLEEPAGISTLPVDGRTVPMAIEQAEPGGVSCTRRSSALITVS